MFIPRLVSSILLSAVFLTAFFWKGLPGKIIFAGFSAFFAYFAVYEFLKIIERTGRKSYPKTTGTISVLFILSAFCNFGLWNLPVLMALIVWFWVCLLFNMNKKDVFEKTLNSISSIFLVILPLSCILTIYMFEGSGLGRNMALFLVAVTKLGDIGAYVIGVLSSRLMSGGNHKIIPTISPKKSWEGAIGGLIFSVAGCIFLDRYLLNGIFSSQIEIILGVFLFFGGFLGDISESALKRIAEVKDSGNIIPGIGGALDILDSLIFNAPFFLIFIVHTG